MNIKEDEEKIGKQELSENEKLALSSICSELRERLNEISLLKPINLSLNNFNINGRFENLTELCKPLKEASINYNNIFKTVLSPLDDTISSFIKNIGDVIPKIDYDINSYSFYTPPNVTTKNTYTNCTFIYTEESCKILDLETLKKQIDILNNELEQRKEINNV